MHKKILIANWKCNKDFNETQKWFSQIKENIKGLEKHIEKKIEVIIAPSYIYLYPAYKLIKNYSLPFKLAAQDVSVFEKGSFTGEIGAFQIKDFSQYVIIGHSERRRYFAEDLNILKKKLKNAKLHGLRVIYCTTQKDALIKEADFIAYEPKEAIGTGKNLEPEKIMKRKKELCPTSKPFLYGGSVNENNIKDYLPFEIDGFLVGSASLNPTSFSSILKKILDY